MEYLKDIARFMRTVVRPVVTVGLVSASIAWAFVHQSAPPSPLGELTGVAVAFWFAERATTYDND